MNDWRISLTVFVRTDWPTRMARLSGWRIQIEWQTTKTVCLAHKLTDRQVPGWGWIDRPDRLPGLQTDWSIGPPDWPLTLGLIQQQDWLFRVRSDWPTGLSDVQTDWPMWSGVESDWKTVRQTVSRLGQSVPAPDGQSKCRLSKTYSFHGSINVSTV